MSDLGILDTETKSRSLGARPRFGAWATTRLSMNLLEMSALGARLALARLPIGIAGIAITAWAIRKALPRGEL